MEATEIVRVETPEPPSTGFGLKLPVIPAVAFVNSETGPVNPRIGEIETVEVAEDADAMINLEVLVVNAKSGGRSTVTLMMVECDPGDELANRARV